MTKYKVVVTFELVDAKGWTFSYEDRFLNHRYGEWYLARNCQSTFSSEELAEAMQMAGLIAHPYILAKDGWESFDVIPTVWVDLVDWDNEGETRECPFCGSEHITMNSSAGLTHCVCHGCGARSKPCRTREGAIKSWNKRCGR